MLVLQQLFYNIIFMRLEVGVESRETCRFLRDLNFWLLAWESGMLTNRRPQSYLRNGAAFKFILHNHQSYCVNQRKRCYPYYSYTV